ELRVAIVRTKSHRAVIKCHGRHPRSTGVRQSNVREIPRTKLVDNPWAEGVDEVELEIGEGILHWVCKAACALWQSRAKFVGLALPIKLGEEAVLVAHVVIQPQHALVAFK